mgnify:CR=1 FL=1
MPVTPFRPNLDLPDPSPFVAKTLIQLKMSGLRMPTRIRAATAQNLSPHPGWRAYSRQPGLKWNGRAAIAAVRSGDTAGVRAMHTRALEQPSSADG